MTQHHIPKDLIPHLCVRVTLLLDSRNWGAGCYASL